MPDTGLLQHLDYGTATTVNTTVGKAVSASLGKDSGLVHRQGVGAQDAIVGGKLAPGGSAEFNIQAGTLINYAIRSGTTTPALTALTFAGGAVGDARQQTGCKLNTLGLSCSIGEPLNASISWLALTDAAYTAAAIAYEAGITFEWFTGVVTVGGTAWNTTSFGIDLNNNLEHLYYMDSAPTNSMRFPKAIKIGSSSLTVRCDMLTRPGSTMHTDIFGDTLAQNTSAVFVLKGGTSGTQTLTLTCSNLARKSFTIPIVVGGALVGYSMDFEAVMDTAHFTAVVS